MSRLATTEKVQPDWWGKIFAGAVFGLALSFGMVGLFAWLGSDGLTHTISVEKHSWRTQFNMWIIPPIWLLILSFVFMFRSAKQALIWLGGANILVYVLLYFVRRIA